MNVSSTCNKTQSNNDKSVKFKICPVKVPTGAKQIGNYILGKTIGSGTFGKVHLGLHIPTGEKVAVKIIEKAKLHTKDLQRIHREIQILKKIMHSSLIQLYQIIQTQKSLLLIAEYMENGELFNYIIQRKKLSEDQARTIFKQLIEAVHYLHCIGVAHRDLKPENILIDYDGRIKVIDFGLSNTYRKNQKLKTQCGSPCYAAPEMIEGKNKYEPVLVDIWSSGIVLFAMLAGHLPFCDPDTSNLYKKILEGSFKFPTWISNQAKDLISKILVVDSQKRIRITQILQHPWIQKQTPVKSAGINLNCFRVPYQKFILDAIEEMGIKIPNLVNLLESNEKSKQTALYYIIAKKMMKQGYELAKFYCSKHFKMQELQPFELQILENQQSSTQIDVQVVSPVPVNVLNNNSPETNSGFEFYSMSQNNFKEVVDQFLKTEPRDKQNQEISVMRGQFYANSLEIKKKKQNLNLEPKKLQKTQKQDRKQKIDKIDKFDQIDKNTNNKKDKVISLLKIYMNKRCQTLGKKTKITLPQIINRKINNTSSTNSFTICSNSQKKQLIFIPKFASLYKGKTR